MSAPATPGSTYASSPSTLGTGSWRHPAMDTIVQRNKLKGPTDMNLNRLAKNLLALIASYIGVWFLQNCGWGYKNFKQPFVVDVLFAMGHFLTLLRFLFLYNIAEVTVRLLRKEPDYSDLALTPVQRKLLGLDPKVTSKAKTGYITPPRYPKSSPSTSPLSMANTLPTSPSPTSPGSASLRTARSGSPTPLSLSETGRRSSFTSPTTLSQLQLDSSTSGSPLRTTNRPNSYFSQSLGFSIATSSSSGSTMESFMRTPSPATRYVPLQGGPGIPVGNRWIYEKMGKRGEGARFGRSSVLGGGI